MLSFLKSHAVYMGIGAIIVAAFLWSLDGLFFRTQLYGLPAEVVVFWEHLLGFILLSPFLALGFSKLRYLTKRDWISIMWISLVGSLFGTLFITKAFFAAYSIGLSITIVVVLQKLQPLTALLLARLVLKERLTKMFYIWAAIAIGAAYFLAFGAEGLHLPSKEFFTDPAWFAILAAVAFGSSTVFGKHLVYHIDFKTAAALRFGFGSLFALLYLTLFIGLSAVTQVEPVEWKYIFIIVCSTGTVALFIYYFGLKRVPASVATLAELFFPLFTVILELLFFDSFLTPVQVAFSLVFVGAVYLATRVGKAQYTFTSHMVAGMGRGEKMGYRTINLRHDDLEIDFGVYLVDVSVSDKRYRGLMHYGPVLTFDEGVQTEVYLQETIDNVADASIQVTTIRRLRDMRKFESTEALVAQIKEDSKALR